MVATAIILSGCNKSIIDEESSSFFKYRPEAIIDSTLGFTVKVQDSTLYFFKAEDLHTATQVLKDMPVSDRRNWEKSVGFISAQTILEDIKSEIIQFKEQRELEAYISANKEFVKSSPDDVNGIKSRIYGYYPYITSKRGFFVCESIWGRVFDGKLYSTHQYNYQSYLEIKQLSVNKKINEDDVSILQLDFNEEDDFELKSHLEELEATSTKIRLRMYNYGTNSPTKRSTFTMQIINTYAIDTLSDIEDYTQYYYYVYYNGYCCDPTDYSYYFEPYGGTVNFEQVSSNVWRIKVPYPDYFLDYPFDYEPNWDSEEYIPITSITYWYVYSGRADLDCTFFAEKRTLSWWTDWSGTALYIKDVNAQIKVGLDISDRSISHQISVGPFGDNYIFPYEENGEASCSHLIYNFVLAQYTNNNTPPVVFKGCVSGKLYSQFCPLVYNFSYNY